MYGSWNWIQKIEWIKSSIKRSLAYYNLYQNQRITWYVIFYIIYGFNEVFVYPNYYQKVKHTDCVCLIMMIRSDWHEYTQKCMQCKNSSNLNPRGLWNVKYLGRVLAHFIFWKVTYVRIVFNCLRFLHHMCNNSLTLCGNLQKKDLYSWINP